MTGPPVSVILITARGKVAASLLPLSAMGSVSARQVAPLSAEKAAVAAPPPGSGSPAAYTVM